MSSNPYADCSRASEYAIETADNIVNQGSFELTESGNLKISLIGVDEKYKDILGSETNFVIDAIVKDIDDVRDSAIVIIDEFEDYYPKVELSNIGKQHQGDIIRTEVQIQDTAKPSISNITAEWKCQKNDNTEIKYPRWKQELDYPLSCSNDDCNCKPTKRISNAGLQINTQQIVYSETDKDDRNSRNLIGEIDEPLIGDIHKRDSVEILAQVQIADRKRESKVSPYLWTLGAEKIGHKIELDDEREAELKKIVDESEDIIGELKESVAPEIVDKCNQDKAKIAMLCSMVKGADHTDRDMIHALFYGKRGSGKSKIMESGEDIADISQFVDAQTATSAGLTASANQTSKLQGEGEQWVVTGGSIPQAHEGTCFVDELDKAEERIQMSIANPMSSGRVIKKSAGNATLPAQTSVVSACNPPDETYKGEDPIKSLNIPHHIKDRFDLILRVDDEVNNINKEREVLKEQMRRKNGEYDVSMNEDTLQDYIALAKRKEPEMTDEAQDEIIENILELKMDIETDIDGIEMSGREQEKLTRLSSAMCKLRLGDKVKIQDVDRAWNIMVESYESLIFDSLSVEVGDTV